MQRNLICKTKEQAIQEIKNNGFNLSCYRYVKSPIEDYKYGKDIKVIIEKNRLKDEPVYKLFYYKGKQLLYYRGYDSEDEMEKDGWVF